MDIFFVRALPALRFCRTFFQEQAFAEFHICSYAPNHCGSNCSQSKRECPRPKEDRYHLVHPAPLQTPPRRQPPLSLGPRAAAQSKPTPPASLEETCSA